MNEESYICHLVIPSRNYDASRKFYESVFGWRTQQQPGTTSIDILPPSEMGISAELNSEEDSIVPSIHVVDIDRTLELVEKHGGKKLGEKTPIGESGEYGHFALFEDPHGNRMVLYSES